MAAVAVETREYEEQTDGTILKIHGFCFEIDENDLVLDFEF